MIRATIRRGSDSATMTWTPDQHIQLEGHPDLCARVDHAIRPGAKAVYNPHLGGLYRGFDRSHPMQVADALQELPKLVSGASVEMHQNDHQPEGPPPAWASSDGHNWLDQGFAESLRPGPMDPSVRRVVFDAQGRAIHLPEPPAPPPESVTVQAYTRRTPRGAQQVQQHQRRRHKLGKGEGAAALLGLLWTLLKAKTWTRSGVEQASLFGAARPAPPPTPPEPLPAPEPPTPPEQVEIPNPPPPPAPAPRTMSADQRKEALSAARRVLADPTSPPEQLHQALRALPPDGSKAAELREQLQARLGRPAEPTSPTPTPSKPSPSPGPAPVKQALPPAAADATASGTASGPPSGDAEREAIAAAYRARSVVAKRAWHPEEERALLADLQALPFKVRIQHPKSPRTVVGTLNLRPPMEQNGFFTAAQAGALRHILRKHGAYKTRAWLTEEGGDQRATYSMDYIARGLTAREAQQTGPLPPLQAAPAPATSPPAEPAQPAPGAVETPTPAPALSPTVTKPSFVGYARLDPSAVTQALRTAGHDAAIFTRRQRRSGYSARQHTDRRGVAITMHDYANQNDGVQRFAAIRATLAAAGFEEHYLNEPGQAVVVKRREARQDGKESGADRRESMARFQAQVAAERSARPPGQGWEQVPGTRHNGWRRRRGIGQGYEYWYPNTTYARADQHEVAGEDRAGARLYAETKGYHPDHLHPEPQKLATKAREKGEKLLAEGAELSGRTYASSSRTASENAANAHARGAEATALGRRLVRFADRVEREGYQPTHFDAAMLETRPREAARMLQRRAERHAESLAEVARYGPSPSRSVHGADTDHVYVRAPTDLMPYKTPEATQNAVKRAIAGYERVLAQVSGSADRGAGHVRATADNIEALQAAHAKLAKHKNFLGQNKGDGHLDLLAHQRIGFVGAGDRAAVVERYKRWKADNGTAAEAPRPATPDRSGARDPFEARLARAELEERRRFIPQTMQGIPSFFETPPPVVERMIEEADIQPGMSVLEPSAGRGGIADRLPGDVAITVAERSSTLRDELQRKGYQPLLDGLEVQGTFDRIIMNPPFEANADIDHARHAFDRNLKPGGRLVAIVGAGAFQRQGKKEQAFRDWLDALGASYEPLPDDTFKRSGTLARSYLVVVDKGRDAVQMAAKASGGLARALGLLRGLRAPADVPQALHKGLLVALAKAERGEAIPEMTWEQDGATCSVVLTAGGARVLTIRHPRLTLPYHLLVPSAAEARAACARALPVLLSGRTPPEGMFRQVGPLPVGGLKGYAVHA